MPSTGATATASDQPGRPQAGFNAGFAGGACLFTALMALTVLAGWQLDLPLLRSVIPGAVEMKANTAIGLLAGAAALALLAPGARGTGAFAPTLARLLAGCVAVLGLATLAEYGFGWNLHIDELLYRDTAAAYNQARGRMSPYSALAFVTLGVALLGLQRLQQRPLVSPQVLPKAAGGLVGAIGILSVLGYLWNVSEIVTDRVAPPVAVHTACAFVLLGSAIYRLASRRNTTAARAHSRLETLVLGGFIPTALFVLMGGGLIYRSSEHFAATAERVAHTQAVRAQLGRVYGAISNAELARRNQLLTGEAAFAGDFEASARETSEQLAMLRRLVADNPAQLALRERLASLANAHTEALQEIGQILAAEGPPAAQRALRAASGAQRMPQIRALLQEMDDAEVTLLEARLREAQSLRKLTLVALFATLAVLSAVFTLLFRSIRQEVTDRNAAEIRLQQLNAELEDRVRARTTQLEFQQLFLRRVIDLNENLIFAKDLEGRFLLANQAVAEAYGTTVDRLVGHHESEFNPDLEQVRRFHAADRQVIESGHDLFIAEEEVASPVRGSRWVSTVKRPMPSVDGQATILLGVSTDITERKAAEDQLRRMAQTLEQRVAERTLELERSNAALVQARLDSDAASRAKSAFLANMSHEIRTPMNAIIGLTHLMTRETRDAMQRDRLDKIGNAAHHLLQIINDILDISKIEAGKLTLEDAEFSVDRILSDVVELVATQARAKGLELIVDPDHLPRRLRGDATRLSQILINLLANAVKFTESGWVRLRGQVVAEEPHRLQLRFEIQDTGPGIPADRQDLLFSAFEQADSSSSRRHGGTGLGLALSRQLARAMGGDAGVVSAAGTGSQFWFTAWLSRVAAPALQASPVAPVLMAGRRALLVDDLPEARAVIGDRLRQMGLVVDELDSGAAALHKLAAELAAGRTYDVLLIDWLMEPMDGIETLGRLRALTGAGMPPSILVTAFDDPALARQARSARFDAVMLKPITASALLDQLVKLFRQQGGEGIVALSAPSEAEALLAAHHRGERVLLAEDNPVNQELAKDLLEMAGLVVEVAEDGAEAVEMALSRPYRIVLMDVQMPVMDGMAATVAIRRGGATLLPIIAMTANAFNEDRQACLAAGMNDHVAKPVNPQQMYATLLRWLQHT